MLSPPGLYSAQPAQPPWHLVCWPQSLSVNFPKNVFPGEDAQDTTGSEMELETLKKQGLNLFKTCVYTYTQKTERK